MLILIFCETLFHSLVIFYMKIKKSFFPVFGDGILKIKIKNMIPEEIYTTHSVVIQLI